MKSIMGIHVQMIIFDKNSGKMEKTILLFSCHFFIFSLRLFSSKGKNGIKVITLNVRYDNPADSVNAWPERASQVCNFIINEKPDIIGMQEVLWNQYKVLDSVLTDYSSVGVGRTTVQGKGR